MEETLYSEERNLMTSSKNPLSSENEKVERGAYIRPLIGLCLIFFCTIIFSTLAGELLNRLLNWGERSILLLQSVFQALLCFVVSGWLSDRIVSRRPWRYMGLTRYANWKIYIYIVIIYTLAIPFMNWLIAWNEGIILPESMSTLEKLFREMEERAGDVTSLMLATDTVGGLLLNLLVMSVIVGFSEEVFFRGAMQKLIVRSPYISGIGGVWIAAIIFSAAHFQFYGFIPRLLLGAFFGYMFYKTGSLWPGIFAHALNNGLVVFSEWGIKRGVIECDPALIGVPGEGEFPILALISLVVSVNLIYILFRNVSVDDGKE